MELKEMNMMIKIFGILGVIFCLLTLLTPWSESSFTFGFFSQIYSTPFYIDFFTNTSFHNIFGAGQIIFFAIAMIIIFILTLIALILSINNVRNISRVTPNKYLTLGILLIVDVILYIIAVSILSSSISTFGAYGIGFVMAIISAIMFFMIYFIQKTFMPAVSPGHYQHQPYQQPTYAQQPAYQHPTQQTPPPVHPQQHHTQQTPPSQPQAQPQQQTQKTVDKPATPKFCSQCGAPVVPNTKFCAQCGNKL